jgi:hypothetical protein
MNDVIKNLYTLFDAAFEENMNGRGTDITRMVTTFVPDAIQNLQACEDMFNAKEITHETLDEFKYIKECMDKGILPPLNSNSNGIYIHKDGWT